VSTRRLEHPLLLRLLGLALGAVFVYASLDKIADPTAFARVVYRYQVVGPNALVGTLPANLVAVTLPWLELLAGLLLMTGVWRREAAAVVAALLAIFVAGVASTMWRGLDIENCGCFTVSGAGRAAGWGLILTDLLLLAAALVLVRAPLTQPAGLAPPAPASHPLVQEREPQ